MVIARFAATAMLLLAGCENYPRDIEGTTDSVRQHQQIRAGVIDGLDARHAAQAARFVTAVERATDARATLSRGAGEPLLAALDAGQLDLVIGEVATDSPWLKDAAVIEPLAKRRAGKSELGLSPIARNGENRWIMLLEKAVRAQGGDQ